MLALIKRRQIVGYVPEPMKIELEEMKAWNPRLSESALVEEAFEISMPQLRQRHGKRSGVFQKPSHDNPRRMKRA